MNKSSFNQNLLNRFIVERKAYDVYREYRLSTLAFSILILCIMKLVDAPSFVFWSFISCLFVLFVFFIAKEQDLRIRYQIAFSTLCKNFSVDE